MLLAASACSGGPEHGKIVGDVYIAPDLNRVIDLREVPVRLIEDVEDFDSLLALRCPHPPGQRPRSSTVDSAAIRQAWVARERFLAALVRRSARSDVQARFVLDSVAPGRYRLWAEARVGEKRWTWLQRVGVRAGDSVRVNLSNDNSDEDPFRCYMIPGSDGFLFR